MMDRNTLKKIYPKRINPGIFLLILLLLFGMAQAQKSDTGKSSTGTKSATAAKKPTKKKGMGINAEVGLAMGYDDNILKYSEKYLDRFMNGQDSGRFHVNTYDDFILASSIALDRNFKIFGKKTSTVDASYAYSWYTVNPINNWSTMGIGFRQNFAKRASFKISYSYIPEYYVRHFRDEDWVDVYGYTPITYQPYSFSKDTYGFWIQNTFFKNSRVQLTYNYQLYYHNEHYTEYDSKNHLYRIKLFQPLSKALRLELMYQFTRSNAKGYDGPDESIDFSDDPDATFDEDGFVGGIVWNMPKIRKLTHSLKGECVIYNRYYQTEQFVTVDPLHAGRIDKNLRFYFNYDISLSKQFSLNAYYNWLWRDSGSETINDQYISDEKDYKQNQIGLELKYNFKF